MSEAIYKMEKKLKTTFRPNPTAILNPCADPIFKALFTQETKESRIALTAFLSAIFGKPVKDLQIRQNELNVESLYEKQSRFDVVCTVGNIPVNIEMQGINDENSYDLRAEYNVAHLLNHFVKIGHEWRNVPKAFQISVLNFIYEKSVETGFHHYTMKTEDGRNLGNRLNIIFLELPKYDKDDPPAATLTPVEAWCKFFLYANRPEKIGYIAELAKHQEGIMEADVTIQRLSGDEAKWQMETEFFIARMDRNTILNKATEKGFNQGMQRGIEEGMQKGMQQGMQQGMQKGIQQGIQEGIQRGIEEGKLAAYKQLIADGLATPEQISSKYNIPIEDLK